MTTKSPVPWDDPVSAEKASRGGGRESLKGGVGRASRGGRESLKGGT